MNATICTIMQLFIFILSVSPAILKCVQLLDDHVFEIIPVHTIVVWGYKGGDYRVGIHRWGYTGWGYKGGDTRVLIPGWGYQGGGYKGRDYRVLIPGCWCAPVFALQRTTGDEATAEGRLLLVWTAACRQRHSVSTGGGVNTDGLLRHSVKTGPGVDTDDSWHHSVSTGRGVDTDGS